MDDFHCSSRLTWQREGFGCGFFFFPKLVVCSLLKGRIFKKKKNGKLRKDKGTTPNFICGVEGGWRETEYTICVLTPIMKKKVKPVVIFQNERLFIKIGQAQTSEEDRWQSG